MALQYGVNITASDMQKLLERNDKQQSGVRTWRQLFGNAALGHNAQSDALLGDYSSAIAQAYKSNLEQNAVIAGAGLSAGSTQEMLSASRNDLLSAYNTYIANYAKDATTLAENYNKEVTDISADLTARAENFAKLYNTTYQYLAEELNGASYTRDGTTVDFFTDQGLNWAIDPNTNELASWDVLSQQLFSDGELTLQGQEFFDQMFNTPSGGWTTAAGNPLRGFDKWLSDTDADLREWWASQDAYNYTFAGSNAGTSKQLMGLESTDSLYQKLDSSDTDFSVNAKSILDEFSAMDTSITTALEDFNKATQAYENFDEEVIKNYPTTMRKEERDKAIAEARKNRESDYKEAKAAFDTAWQDYYAKAVRTNTSLTSSLKNTMGPELYQEFYNMNKYYFDKLDTWLKNAKSVPDDYETYAAEFERYSRYLIERAEKTLSAQGKGVSGF